MSYNQIMYGGGKTGPSNYDLYVISAGILGGDVLTESEWMETKAKPFWIPAGGEAWAADFEYLPGMATHSGGSLWLARAESQGVEPVDGEIWVKLIDGIDQALFDALLGEAGAARDAAVGAMVGAQSSEAGSVAARAAAEVAQALAETARDAASVNADVYATTAAGLAATAEGEQFQVVTGTEAIRYRHDAGAVATEVSRMATSGAVTALEPRLIPSVLGQLFVGLPPETGYAAALTDHDGAVCFYIGNDGTFVPVKLAPISLTLPVAQETRLIPSEIGLFFTGLPPETGYAGAMTDQSGAVCFYIENDGTFVPVKLAPISLTLPAGSVGPTALTDEVASMLSGSGARGNANYLLTTYLVGTDRRVRSVRRSDGRAFELTPSGSWTDPQILDDDTVFITRISDGASLYVSPSGGDILPALPESTIEAWGDSITQGVNGPSYVWVTLLGDALGRATVNQGRPGQPTRTILAAFDGSCGLTLSGDAIPASGPVSITAVTNAGDGTNFPITALEPADMEITLAGVPGILSASSYSPLVATFTRTTAGAVVPVEPATTFTTALGTAGRGRTVIWWTGRNNGLPNLLPYARPQIAQAVDYLTPLVGRFLVVGMTTRSDGTEAAGSYSRSQIDAFNAALANDYGAITFDGAGMPTGGGRFVNVLDWLIAHGLTVTGTAQTATDTSDIALGNIPSSLMAPDKLHLSIAGDQAVGILMTRIFQFKGY